MAENVKPIVINVKQAPKGWKDDPQYVDVRRMRNGRVNPNVGVSGYFGNPYPLSPTMSRYAAIQAFRSYAEQKVKTDPDYRNAVCGLAGKILVCCCKPSDCHGDILAEIADRLANVLVGGSES